MQPIKKSIQIENFFSEMQQVLSFFFRKGKKKTSLTLWKKIFNPPLKFLKKNENFLFSNDDPKNIKKYEFFFRCLDTRKIHIRLLESKSKKFSKKKIFKIVPFKPKIQIKMQAFWFFEDLSLKIVKKKKNLNAVFSNDFFFKQNNKTLLFLDQKQKNALLTKIISLQKQKKKKNILIKKN